MAGSVKVLVVGATGKFASLVIPELKKRGASVRALVHDAKDEAQAGEHGADESVIADLSEPATLRPAARGVDGIFHINPAFAPHESHLGLNMVEAAKAEDVAKFVFSGVIHPTISKMSNHSEKGPVEEALYESGLNFCVLQPTMFMQNLQGGWKEVTEKGTFSLPYSRIKKASYVDYRDVAESAAIALTSDKLDYGTFELCAPGMLDRYQLTALMSKAIGRPVEPLEPTFSEWVAQTGMPPGPIQDGLKRMYQHYDRYGFPGGNALVLTAILGREPRSMAGYLQELATAHEHL